MSLLKPSAMLTDAFGTLVVRMIGIALIFVSTTVTARLLGPAEYGTWSAAMALALLLATLAPLGSDRILVQKLSTMECDSEIGRETAITHLATAWITALLLCGLLATWMFSSFVWLNSNWAKTSLLAAILFVPLTTIYLRQWLAMPLIGARRAVMPEQTLLPLIFTTTLLTSTVIKLRLTATTTAIAYSAIISFVWLVSLKSMRIRRAYQSALSVLGEIPKALVIQRMIAGTSYVAVAVGAIVSQTCMPLTIAATCGFTETAFYALAMPFASISAIPLGAFNLTMYPRCARLYQNGRMAEAEHSVRSAATIMFGLSVGIGFLMWILSPLLILLLGSEYTTVCRLLPALLLANIADSLTGPTMPVMQTMKLEETYSRMLFASIPVQLGLICLLGRMASVEGAALAYLISRVLWNIALVAVIRQLRGLTMLPYMRFRLAWHEFHVSPGILAGSSRPAIAGSLPERGVTTLNAERVA